MACIGCQHLRAKVDEIIKSKRLWCLLNKKWCGEIRKCDYRNEEKRK